MKKLFSIRLLSERFVWKVIPQNLSLNTRGLGPRSQPGRWGRPDSCTRDKQAHTRDTRSYPGSGHRDGVTPYSCMSGIAPVEMIMESLEALGLWEWSTPSTMPWPALNYSGLGPLPPHLGEGIPHGPSLHWGKVVPLSSLKQPDP